MAWLVLFVGIFLALIFTISAAKKEIVQGEFQRPTLPFDNTSISAYAARRTQTSMRYYSEPEYRGAVGFKKMFGSNGWRFDDNTVYIVDGVTFTGFTEIRSRHLAVRNLFSLSTTSECDCSTVVKSYSAYSYVDTGACAFNFALLSYQNTCVRGTFTTTFNDEGVISQFIAETEGGALGNVMGQSLAATVAVTEIGYSLGILDETNDTYYLEYLPYIFVLNIVVISMLFAISMVICVKYVFTAKGKHSKQYTPVKVMVNED